MKILITEPGRFIEQSKESPEVGRAYTLEDATSGTAAQNRAFHSLLTAFWIWMLKTDTYQFENDGIVYDLRTPSQTDFKDFFKYKYGAGFSWVEYVDDNYRMVRVPSQEDVPEYVIKDFNSGNRRRVKGVLKSWADYTKKERKDALDILIHIIAISGCTDKKVMEIISGMDREAA